MCLHYAQKLNAEELISVFECKAAIGSKDEALALSRFFWQMLEAAVEDRDNQIEVLGEKDLQHWMERSMNIISGYLERIGYQDEWDRRVTMDELWCYAKICRVANVMRPYMESLT